MSVLNSVHAALGLAGEANHGDLYAVAIILFIILSGVLNFLLLGKSSQPEVEKAPIPSRPKVSVVAEEKIPTPSQPIGPSWSDRLKKGLGRSRTEVWGKIHSLFSGNKLSGEMLEEIEELLYTADIGPKAVQELIDHLNQKTKEKTLDEFEFRQELRAYLHSQMDSVQSRVDQKLLNYSQDKKRTEVIMIVGVNGAGKTTTIGKLATKLTRQGAKVVVGAGDTFRAAAVDQLQVWCDRAGAEMVRAKEGSNPSGVAFEALQKAIHSQADYCILDTAGRLHTKENLMEELKKFKNVLKKLDESAPHHTLLVIDAITGQNAVRQAQEFNQALGLSGLIFTKCDGSSKAGSAISIVQQLQVPIAYIGVGEDVEDLNVFNLDEYLTALLES
ncbi:MAG: signal recognition particle-docking protein FtsY [Bdellovibrio sp.]